jgi:putative oxidoreductase
MNQAFQTPLVVAGRLLLAFMFVTAGYSKLVGIEGTAAYIASVGLPLPTLLAVASGLFELVAGLALAIGFHARWAALGLGLFTLLAGALFHAYWSAPAEQQMVQQLMFTKNLAIAGGLFILAALGAGGLSVDARAGRALAAA